MTVYVEYVLIDNFVIDYMLLKAAFFTAGGKPKKRRLVFCALFGAVFALLYPLMEIHPVILAAVKILAGAFMTLCADKFDSVKKYVIVSALFLTYTFVLGGAITGVYSVLGLNPSSEISIAVMALPAYALIKTAYSVIRFIYRRKDVAALTYEIEISLAGKTIKAQGFLDTGNGLYDGESPAVICSKAFAGNFIAGTKLPAMKKIWVGTVNGGEEKLAFSDVRIDIYTQNGVISCKNITLCVSGEGFSGYDVILHPALFDGAGAENAKEIKSAVGGGNSGGQGEKKVS